MQVFTPSHLQWVCKCQSVNAAAAFPRNSLQQGPAVLQLAQLDAALVTDTHQDTRRMFFVSCTKGLISGGSKCPARVAVCNSFTCQWLFYCWLDRGGKEVQTPAGSSFVIINLKRFTHHLMQSTAEKAPALKLVSCCKAIIKHTMAAERNTSFESYLLWYTSFFKPHLAAQEFSWKQQQ